MTVARGRLSFQSVAEQIFTKHLIYTPLPALGFLRNKKHLRCGIHPSEVSSLAGGVNIVH